MVLSYTARTVRDLEKEAGKPIYELVMKIGMEALVLLVKYGMKVDEEVAFDEIDKQLKEGKEMTEMYVDVLEALQVGGFLPKALKIKEIRATITGEKGELKA
jgi:hypothetical protein